MSENETRYQHVVATIRSRRRADPLDQRIVNQAQEVLEGHPHFQGRSELMEIRCEKNCLRLGGVLPSYFLKQLAQEALRPLGDFNIDNQIVVTGMIGEMFSDDDQHPSNSAPTAAFRRYPR